MKGDSLELLFTADEVRAIGGAVARAEAAADLEIVAVAVPASGDYAWGAWKAAALGLFFGFAAEHAFVRFFPGSWGVAPWVSPVSCVAFVATYFSWAALRRRVIGRVELDARVWDRARALFLEHGVFRTARRTGVLVLVSRFEHEVAVLADQGAYRRAAPEFWKAFSDDLAAAMKAKRPAETFLAAIEGLAKLRADGRAKEANELPDDLVIGDR